MHKMDCENTLHLAIIQAHKKIGTVEVKNLMFTKLRQTF